MDFFHTQNTVSRRRFLGLTSFATLKTLLPGRQQAAGDQARREFKIQVTAEGGMADPDQLSKMLDELTRGLVLERRQVYATCHVYACGDVALRVQDAQSGRTHERRIEQALRFDQEDGHSLYANTLELAVEMAPEEAYLVRALGDHYLAFRQYDAGIACFEALVETYPQNVLLSFQLGMLYERSRRKEEAQRAFYRAYALDPHDPVTLYNLGVTASDLGQLQEAERWFRAALARDPGLVDARARLDWLRDRRKTVSRRLRFSLK